MRDLAILFIHLLATIAKLMRPGGARAVVAESLLVKHQLVILNRGRERAPNLRPMDRVIAGLCIFFMRPGRLIRSAIVLKPSTFLAFHGALVKCKYRLLFTPKNRGKPGPKGPSPELIAAIVEMKRKNPRFGCRRIAQQIAFIFGVEIDKDIVRRVLARHYRPEPGSGGPSWLTFLGHSKDSLWSVDMFRCEPRYLSSDNDPLFRYHQWKANLRILDIKEVETVPYIPLSHPFVERLVGSVRREFTDQTPFWHARDLERKLRAYADYYNGFRVHHALDGVTPQTNAGDGDRKVANLNNYRWQSHCRGLYQLPVAA